jgi:hypothetical protein
MRHTRTGEVGGNTCFATATFRRRHEGFLDERTVLGHIVQEKFLAVAEMFVDEASARWYGDFHGFALKS